MKATKASREFRVPSFLLKGDYQSAFHHTDVALLLLDLDLTILDANDRCRQLLVRPGEELIGAPIDALFYLETDDFIPQLRRAVEQSTPARFAAEAVLKAGVEIKLSALIHHLDAADEGQILVSLREGSEPQGTEEAWRESEDRFRAMADNAPVMIWQSGTDKLCHYFNRQWLNFTGCHLHTEGIGLMERTAKASSLRGERLAGSDGEPKKLFVPWSGTTRAISPHQAILSAGLRVAGQPLLIGSTMETASTIGTEVSGATAASSREYALRK